MSRMIPQRPPPPRPAARPTSERPPAARPAAGRPSVTRAGAGRGNAERGNAEREPPVRAADPPPPRRGAGRRAGVQDRPSRQLLLLRRARRLLRPGALLAVVAMLALGGALAVQSAQSGGLAARLRDRLALALNLRLRHVIIEGRANTPQALLNAAIGAVPGESLLHFSVSGAQQRIEGLTWVHSATVVRELPDTVVVRLVERRPFAIWQHDNRFSLIDRNGKLVAGEQVAAFRTLPLVVGTGAPTHATALIDLLAQYPALQARVRAMVRIGGRRWNLLLASGMQVMLPDGHAAAALARLAQIQASTDLLDRPLRTIDLRLPDRMVVRLRHDPTGPKGPNGAAAAPGHKPT